jgi:hypothetical protein
MLAQGLIDVMNHLASRGILNVLVVPVGVLVKLATEMNQ